MCNPKPSTTPSSFVSTKKNHVSAKPCNNNNNSTTTSPYLKNLYSDHNNNNNNDDEQLLHRWPTPLEVLGEMKEIGKISGPSAITGLVLYSRSMISMLFLGYLGELQLAGGSLAISFANITGYSVLSGLAMGMEPICGQAYGAKQMKLLGLTLQRTILLLLSTSIPISITWLNMKRILLWCGQDEQISSAAQTFISFAIPDLFFLSFLHPLRVYLRTQNITLPLSYCSSISVLLHVPLNFLLVNYFRMGINGVALSMVLTNLNLVILLICFIYFSRVYKDSWVSPSVDCVRDWSSLLALAVPTCVSVCLEWWWYEFMIMLCGLLGNPKATVASMGVLIQTTSLVYVFPSSLSLGVSTRVGNELGANRPHKARISMIVSLGCAAALGVAAMMFMTLVRYRWGRLFTGDAEILKLTAVALPIAGLCELGNCPQTTGCGVLRGSARPTVGANINLGSFYLVGMPVAIFLGFGLKMGFAGLWIGLLAAQASCAILMLYVLCNTDWKLQGERAKQLTNNNNNNSLSSSSSSSSSCSEKTAILPVSMSSSSSAVMKIMGKDDDLQEILCSAEDDDDDDDDDVLMMKPSKSVETNPLISNHIVH